MLRQKFSPKNHLESGWMAQFSPSLARHTNLRHIKVTSAETHAFYSNDTIKDGGKHNLID